MERWTVDRVLALAPDSASQTAGRKLATLSPWSDIGWADALLWGSCQGSGRTPYKVAIDLSGPSYKCTCPSRKFPCKHTLALLFLWAAGHIEPGGGISEHAAEWLAKREQKAAKATEAEPKEQTAEQRAQAEARAAKRAESVAAGLAELDRWLADQLTTGLVSATVGGYASASRMAARMVDAQAPGIASRLRNLSGVRGADQFEVLLTELAMIRLLITANAAELPDDLRAVLRTRLGYPTSRTDALANPPVADHWLVSGMLDSEVEQVSTRQVWLQGRRTGRAALVLFFSARGQPVDSSLLPGMVVDADLHFYPGRPQLRAAVGEHRGEVGLADWRPVGGSLTQARAAWHRALVADPWLTEWPVAVRGTVHSQPHWAIRDFDGRTMKISGPFSGLLGLLALAGPAQTTWFGEISADGFWPTAVLVGDAVVAG